MTVCRGPEASRTQGKGKIRFSGLSCGRGAGGRGRAPGFMVFYLRPRSGADLICFIIRLLSLGLNAAFAGSGLSSGAGW